MMTATTIQLFRHKSWVFKILFLKLHRDNARKKRYWTKDDIKQIKSISSGLAIHIDYLLSDQVAS